MLQTAKNAGFGDGGAVKGAGKIKDFRAALLDNRWGTEELGNSGPFSVVA